MTPRPAGVHTPGAGALGGDPDLWEEDFSLWELFGDDEDDAAPERSDPSSTEAPVDEAFLIEDQAPVPADEALPMEFSAESSDDEEMEVRALDLPARRRW